MQHSFFHKSYVLLLVSFGLMASKAQAPAKPSKQEELQGRLVRAIWAADLQQVENLLADKAFKKDKGQLLKGTGALVFAAGGQHNIDPKKDIVKALIDAGADVNEAMMEGRLAPIQNAKTGEIVDLLVQHGARVKPDALIHATIMVGVTTGTDVPKALLAAGANVNAQEEQTGDTALHYVFNSNDPTEVLELVKLYLEYGADPTIPNKEGITALSKANTKKFQQVIPLLRDAANRKKSK